MKAMVEAVQTEFFEIEKMLDEALKVSGALDQQFCERFDELISSAYVTMNDSMCDEVEMCRNCSQNRDNLRSMIEFLESHECGNDNDEALKAKLLHFKDEVSEVLGRINEVLMVL